MFVGIQNQIENAFKYQIFEIMNKKIYTNNIFELDIHSNHFSAQYQQFQNNS